MDNKIIADDALLAKVRAAPDPVHLCDASGQEVAVVLSPDFYAEMLLAWSDTQLPAKVIEENRRAVAEGRVKTTAEVLEFLAALDQKPNGEA